MHFSRFANVVAAWLAAIVLLVPLGAWFGAYVYAATPYSTRQDNQPVQPIPFSHQHHVGEMGIDCRMCHSGVEKQRLAPPPTLNTCMTCHSRLWNDAPVLAALRAHVGDHKPLTWTRVHRLPDYVYFDHSVHLANGVGCSECHGDVSQMPLTRQAAPMTMEWCLSCHRDPGPRLRPKEDIYAPQMRRANDPKIAGMLAELYHVDTRTLTDCSTCHR
jgi:hypothetical protein